MLSRQQSDDGFDDPLMEHMMRLALFQAVMRMTYEMQ